MVHLSNPPSTMPSRIECATAARRLWDYLDGRLTLVVRDQIEGHITTCWRCAPRFTFARRMQRALAGLAAPAISDDEESRLRGRVVWALRRLRPTR